MKKEIQEYVGKEAFVSFGIIRVKVIIKDVKNTYGRNRYLVSPIAGDGEIWIENIVLK